MNLECENFNSNYSSSGRPLQTNRLNSSKPSVGNLLMQEVQEVPDVLELDDDSDVDDPMFNNKSSESEDEVVVLGEKRPIYEEITIEENENEDDENIVQNVVKRVMNKRLAKQLEELLYHCPNCNKSFRVESLLKFHVRMHAVVESHIVTNPAPEVLMVSKSPNSLVDKNNQSEKKTPDKHSPKKRKCKQGIDQSQKCSAVQRCAT